MFFFPFVLHPYSYFHDITMNISNWSFNILNQKAQQENILNKASKTMLTLMVSRFLANPNIDTSLNNNYFLKKISSCTTIRKWKLASKPWETSVTSYLLNKETQTTSLWEKGEKERKWCNILLNHEYWFGNSPNSKNNSRNSKTTYKKQKPICVLQSTQISRVMILDAY